ncbi:MAG TPA: hypothetical protein PLM50_02295 [Rectinema sp.]|nr:hypothetical protein [Rectinema sp.]
MFKSHELQSRIQAYDKKAGEIHERTRKNKFLGWTANGKERMGPHAQKARDQHARDVKELEEIKRQKDQIFAQLRMTDEWLDVEPTGVDSYKTRYDPWSKRTQYKPLDVNERQEELPPVEVSLEKESTSSIPRSSSQEEALLEIDIRRIPRKDLFDYKKRLEIFGSKLIRQIKENQTVDQQSVVTTAFQRFVSPYSNLNVQMFVPENDHNGIFIYEHRNRIPQDAAYYASELLKVNKKLKEVNALETQYKQAASSIEEDVAIKENRDSKTVEGYKKFVELFELAGIHADDPIWERSVGEPILEELTPIMSKIIAYGRQNNRFMNERVVKEILQR